ncbi:hypothetical protein VKT23_008070 [Stygiomarasmius scandens]|uniref:Transforming growth factor beta regulator 1 n=1 Tax=Marasmiellus scandens TaxID=2682957 RepID=A0ABR1JJ69_9AGAR
MNPLPAQEGYTGSLSHPAASSLSQGSPTRQKTPTEEDIVEKYQTLKRRYEELENETHSELQNSNEQDIRIQEERMMLLDRIAELEARPEFRVKKALDQNSISQPLPSTSSHNHSSTEAQAHSRVPSADSISSDRGEDSVDSPRASKRARLESDTVPGDTARGTSPQNEISTETNIEDGETEYAAAPQTNTDTFSHSNSDQTSGVEKSGQMEVDHASTSAPITKDTGRRTSKRRAAVPSTRGTDTSAPRRSTRKSAANTDSPVRTITENHTEATQKHSAPKSGEESSQTNEPAIDPSLTGGSSDKKDASAPISNGQPLDSASSASTSSSPSTPITGPGSLSSNPYSIFLTSPPPGIPAFNPYANPYLYMASLAAFPGMHPGMANMHAMVPGMYPGAVPAAPVASSSSQPAQNQSQSQSPNQAKPAEAQHQPQAKTKRLKAHTVKTKNVSIPIVPRDKNSKPMLPLNVGIMTVISLGEVCMREHFHSERYIFPVGYEVTRRYLSTVNPNAEVVYHCTILDGGDGPKFQIVPSDVPDKPVIAGTATGAWSSIVRQANAIRNRQHSNSVSGPDFFGLGQNTIKHLIQELPNADKLRDYVWQNFVEGGPLGGRHAAVIPALPEEYDASLPIGAYYPSAYDRPKRDPGAVPDQPDQPRHSHYPPHIMAQQHSPSPPQAASQGSVSPNQPVPVSQPMSLPQTTVQHVPAPPPNGLHQPGTDTNGTAGADIPASPFAANGTPVNGVGPTTIASIMSAYTPNGLATNGTLPS